MLGKAGDVLGVTITEQYCRTRLTTQDVYFTDIKYVFVNEHLCPQLQKLLGMIVKKTMKWSFAWVKKGKVLAWKMETSPFADTANADTTEC